MGKVSKKILAGLLFVVAIITILFFPLSYRVAIDYEIKVRKIPLFAKACAFLYRDYEYKQLVAEITDGTNSDTEKVMVIYDWTVRNIRKDKPASWPVVDDHIFNIITRGYGTNDQAADVFCILCVYAGIDAVWEKYYAHDPASGNRIASLVLSFVKVEGGWLVFDVFNRKYFFNEKGGIASVSDIIRNPAMVKRQSEGMEIKGVPYYEFFKQVEPVKRHRFSRQDKQKPLKRFIFEIKKTFGMERESEDEDSYSGPG